MTAQAAELERAPTLLDDMNGAKPAFRLLDEPSGARVLRQAIEPFDQQSTLAEHVTVNAPPGASAALAYLLPPASVLPELQLEAWAWCNRPGMQLAALVVLPRTPDPSTGAPRRLLIRSNAPADGAAWQRLLLGRLPELLERQARVVRAMHGPDVDIREAFVSDLVILAPGGDGPTEVWIDQAKLYGSLRPRSVSGQHSVADAADPSGAMAVEAGGIAWPDEIAPSGGNALDQHERPSMPRVLQWQGEPFDLIRRLGFEAAWLGRVPTADELSAASRAGLFLICPPPLAFDSGGLGAEYDGVLAWDLGQLSDAADVVEIESLVRRLKRHDRLQDRLTLLRPGPMPREASRIADVLVLSRPASDSPAAWRDYATWLGNLRRLARPGAAVWATIPTHASNRARAQLAEFRNDRPAMEAASLKRLTMATTAAFGVRPKGFVFESQASLAGTDEQTQMRRLALALTNLRLGLVEPWLSRGKAAVGAVSGQINLTAMSLTVERSHLVVPMQWDEGAARGDLAAESEAGPSPPSGSRQEGSTFVLPGVPESCDAYLISAAGSWRLTTRRVTGGLSVSVDSLPDDGLLMLTEDGRAYSQVERYLRRYAVGAAKARVELAALSRQQAQKATSLMPMAMLQIHSADEAMARADTALSVVHHALASQDASTAFFRAEEAEEALGGLLERLFAAYWPDGEHGASPWPASWSTLADSARLAQAVASMSGPSAWLPGGQFENLAEVTGDGWQRRELATRGVVSAVRLSPDAPQAGAYCLELDAQLDGTSQSVPVLTSPPVWVTSPPLIVPPNHIVEISGWVRVTEAPMGSGDGVLIFDSIGGEESAVRISSVPSWTRFRLVRVPPPGVELRLTVALGGVGRAAVDSLQYRVAPAASARASLARRER